MKNIVCKLVICALTLIMVLAFAACSNTDTDTNTDEGNTSGTINAKLTQITMPFDLEEDSETGKKLKMYTICYSGNDILIVANVYDDITTATEIIYPEIRTNGVYVLNYREASSKLYDLKSENLIYSAVPYKDGILYAESKFDEEHMPEPMYKWNVIYFDGKNQHTIDSGYSINQTAAEVTLIGETPVYISEHTAEGITTVSDKKVVDLSSETIESVNNAKMYSIVETNGDAYLFTLYDRQNETSTLCAGDENEMYLQYQLDDVLNSCTINENYIVASIGEETGKTKIVGIPLDGSEEKNMQQIKRWWRMTGSSGEYCVAVDDNFNPYYIKISDNVVGEITLTDEMENDILVKSFYPAGKDNYILAINNESFYIMELD